MATTQYFPHYSNARNDEKILALRMKYGMEGYGVFFAILERLLDSTDYMLSTNYNLIAFDFRVSNEFIKSIVEDFGLFEFTEDHKSFYSVRFLEHMDYKDDISKKRAEAGRKGGLSKAKKQESSKCLANAKQTSSIKRNETKQNETRRNETKQNPAAVSFFESAWQAYPNKKGKSAVTKKAKTAIQDLGEEAILRAVENYKQDVMNQRANGFTSLAFMNGSTFFNGRYEDFLDASSITPLNGSRPASGTERTRQVLEEMMQDERE